MIVFNLDKAKNRITIKLSGNISMDEAREHLNGIIGACNELTARFTIINDISGLDVDSEAPLVTLNKVSLKLAELYNVGNVIRVIGNSKSLLIQLSQTDKKYNLTNISYVPTMEEALAIANKP